MASEYKPVGTEKTINGKKCVWTGVYWRFAHLPPDPDPQRDHRTPLGVGQTRIIGNTNILADIVAEAECD